MLARSPRKTVLVVEDDPAIREAIADALREDGRRVVEAQDGEEALAKLEYVTRPCLILLDLLMPRMDGFGFLRQLNEHPDALQFPVLVLSAHASVETAEHHPRVVGTLTKPFELHTLLSWVNALC